MNAPRLLVCIFALPALAGLLVLSGCSDSKPSPCLQCGPADQHCSYMAAMNVDDTAHVGIDSTFTAEQRQEIEEGLAAWNEFGRQTIGHDFFTAETAYIQAGDLPKKADDCNFNNSDEHSFQIIRTENNATWSSLALDNRNPGVTIRCTEGADITKQAVYLNTKLAAPGQELLRTAEHEAGHLLGLNHSCNGDGDSPEYVSCAKVQMGHPYYQALMYMYVSAPGISMFSTPTTTGIALTPNDRDRVGCLYQSL